MKSIYIATALVGLLSACGEKPSDAPAAPPAKTTASAPKPLPPGVQGPHMVMPAGSTDEDRKAASRAIIDSMIEDKTIPAYAVERDAIARGVTVDMAEVNAKKKAQGAPTQ